jgi:PKHD-type hydroxylase
MGYTIQKYRAPLECFAVWENGYTTEELDKIKFLAELQSFQKGKIGGGEEAAPEGVRNSDIAWIVQDQHSQWLFERHASILAKVNTDHFLYDIAGFNDFQYTVYGLNQHYTWHWDVCFGWQNHQRKISSVLFLTDPDEYEGGELEIVTTGNVEKPVVLKPKRGECVFFASWMPHRVLPVTSGRRVTLVNWAEGRRES